MKWYRLFNSIQEAEEKLPLNQPKSVALGQERTIAVLRNESGVQAFDNQCPHAGAKLSDGHLNPEGALVCPLHSYRFELKTGREVSGKSCPDLPIYLVQVDEKGVHIGLPG